MVFGFRLDYNDSWQHSTVGDMLVGRTLVRLGPLLPSLPPSDLAKSSLVVQSPALFLSSNSPQKHDSPHTSETLPGPEESNH